MRIRKFVAATMKAALDDVKRELGADAMIVATRHVRRGLLGQGVEITAAVDQLDGNIEDQFFAAGDALSEDNESGPTSMSGEEPSSRRPSAAYGARPAAAPAPRQGITDADLERIMNPLRAELRAMTRSRSAANAAGPNDGAIESLRREVSSIQSMIARIATPKQANETMEPLESIEHMASNANLIAKKSSRITAVVGPTGVGKTTTVAKLAARAALVEKRRVGIITMDTFRIGAEEQIRAYADLIGVPLVLCAEPARLGDALRRLTTCDRIFVDTPGYGPREESALHVLGAALQAAAETGAIDVHLVMPANASRTELDRAATRFQPTLANRLLFTKLDECSANEELVRAPARLSLPVRYLATGQRVPEDLEDANIERLLDLALRGLDIAEAA